MASTTFVDGETLIEASWLNDVNAAVYNPAAAIIPASSIVNTPAGNIAATDVQAAINELDTEKQPLDATLTALAGLATGADKLAYSTGMDTFGQTTLTAFSRTLLDDADAATARGTLGLPALLNQNYGVDGVTKVTPRTAGGVDFNTHTSAGVYNFDAASSANAPVTGLYWVFLEVFRHFNLAAFREYTVQIAHDMNAGTRPRSWTRRQVAGSWSAWVETTLPEATASVNGYMTAAYASKLDGIAAGANVGYPTDAGVNAIGMLVTAKNNSGSAAVASGGTTSGAKLVDNVVSSTLPGTWRNVGAASVADQRVGRFQRIA